MVHAIRIAESLRPRIFISYSRRDVSFLQNYLLKPGLVDQFGWVDRHNIAPGEDWRAQIELGIHASDELLLLLSLSSAASQEVRHEVNFALSRGKPVYVVMLEKVDPASVPWVQHVNWLDLSQAAPDFIHAHLKLHFGYGMQARPADKTPAGIRFLASRTIWPHFQYPNPHEVDPVVAQAVVAASANSSPGSNLKLNAALIQASLGRNEEAITMLNQYAHECRNFAGWYFLALVNTRATSIRRLTRHQADLGLMAARQANAQAPHALARLLQALYEVQGENRPPGLFETVVPAFEQIWRQTKEHNSEVLRFLYFTKPGLSEMGRYEAPLLRLLKEADQ